jgi:exonuclease III
MIDHHPGPSCEDKQDENQSEKNKQQTWGDSIKNKTSTKSSSSGTIRIAFQNINGFGYTDKNNKAENIRSFIKENNIDIMAIVETNVNWKRVRKKMTIWDKTRGWFENQRVSAAYNSHDRSGKRYQPGGCAIITQGELALRSDKSGQDNRKLGRWTWTTYQGKNGIKLRVISVYVPNTAKQYGIRKTYSQQQQVLLSKGIKTNPISIFWTDFWEMVDKSIEEGEQLIIGGDWNTDIRDEEFLQKFQERKIIPSIISRHGKKGPETYHRGSVPIDEIFISKNISITKCGYLQHGINCSDHRAIWIDLNKISVLGSKLPDIPYYQARRLKCQDPRVVKKYLTELDKHMMKHNAYERLQLLYQQATNPLSQEAKVEYEKLDKIREIGMIKSEKKCRKLRMGNIRWSPELQKARDRIEYFKASLSRAKGSKVSARFLIQLGKKCEANSRGMDILQLEKESHDAFVHYKTIRENHQERRDRFIDELAEAQAEAGNKKKAQILKDMIQVEKQRSVFRRISLIAGEKQNLGTTFVEVKDSNGNIEQITDQHQMEVAIINENRKKYHQTENSCPFHSEPLKSHFGNYGEGPQSEAVAKGSYDPPASLDEYTTAYIKACAQDNKIKQAGDAQFIRTQQEYEKSWSLMKEKTASRTLHFGHFKAGLGNPEVSKFHYLMAEIPLHTGYSPVRWKQATNVMILKKAGLYSLEKLRTLVLFEADFNHNNKFCGRTTMQHSLANDKIAIEQYSVPGKKSIDHALNRRLVFDIVRYLKISLAMTSCDLKSCYDRIAHTPAFLALRRTGIPKEVIFSMLETIQNAEFITRTAYGDSKITFGGKETGFTAKPQGTGQGNGAAPQIWAVVSSAMFEVMHQKGLGTNFKAPISKEELELCGFAFVDDSDIIATSGHQNNPDETVTQMQKTINCWDGVARATGGALAPDKSWWYLIHFEWQHGDAKYGDLENLTNNELQGKDKNGNVMQLKYLESHEAQEMLGVFLAPNGSNEKQIEIFIRKMEEYSEMIRTGHLDRHEAWTALNLVAIKKLEYALPALTLTAEDCKSIMWPLLQAILPKSGINRYIKRDLLYAPIDYQGLGVQNIYLTQGINHIVDIVEHKWKKTLTGHFITSSLECLRLETGIQGNIFSHNFYDYQPFLLNQSWIENTWKFTSDNKITILEETSDFNLRRHNDLNLMEQATDIYISNTEAKEFNKCRIYLQALTLADITKGDGRGISYNSWNGIQSPSTARNQFTWPITSRPPNRNWNTWRRILRTLFECNENGKFTKITLQDWQQDKNQWQWHENQLQTSLYQNKNGIWLKYSRAGRSKLAVRYSTQPTILTNKPEEHIERTTVYEKKNYYYSEGISPLSISPLDQLTPQNTISKFLTIEQVSTHNIQQIITDLSKGTAKAVTDGSFDPHTKTGSAAWIIESENQTQYIAGSSITYGPPTIQGSYRSEITGLAAILDATQKLCTQYNITSGHYTLGCDNINALKRSINTKQQQHSPKHQQSDILSFCCQTQSNTPLTISPQHIKAHQDDKIPYYRLSRMSQLNVRMDIAAKRALRLVQEKKITIPSTEPSTTVGFSPVYVNNTRIWHNLHKDIYKAIMKDKITDYWEEKGRINSTTRTLIDWDSIGKGMKGMISTRRRFVSKWSAHQLGTGKNLVRWKHRPHGKCPFCLQDDEDTAHILSCTHTEPLMEWYKQLDNFLSTLTSIGTCPVLLVTLRYDLIAWKLNNNKEASLELLNPSQKTVILEQRQIGWTQFLEGLLTKQWVQYHDELFKDNQSKRTGSAWAAKVYRSGWTLIYNLWTFRNKKLHETDRILDMEGRQEINDAIVQEWKIGIGTLPAIEFSYLLSGKIEQTLSRSIQHKRSWLAIVRQGRILHEDPHLIHDGFMINGALRTSIGLPTVPN